MEWGWVDWVAAAALGGVVGASELISRYKDAPSAAIRSWPSLFYIAVNCAASAGALGAIRANGWFGASGNWMQILLAGVSAMAFFRTSLFVVRAGDRDVVSVRAGFFRYSSVRPIGVLAGLNKFESCNEVRYRSR